MAVINLYSKRRKAQRQAGKPDVYRYDAIPLPFRVQMIHIWRDSIGVENKYGDPNPAERWQFLHDAMAREKGVMQLGADYLSMSDRCEEWFTIANDDDAIDMIELTFRLIDRGIRKSYPDTAVRSIEELNIRFREHGLGYQFEGGRIIRLDNQYVHAELIKPALALVSDPVFATANDEFITAHKHYRDEHYKDCIVAAQRAFESTLKAICKTKNWPYAPGDRAAELITAVRNQGLFPEFLGKAMDTYVAMLKTGLPGIRNNAGGHGDGPNAPAVPGYLAAHALHLTAANIVLAVEAFRTLK